MNKPCPLRAALLLSLLIATQLEAAQLLPNGDFESPILNRWEDRSGIGSNIDRVARGDCFAGLDTKNLDIRGQFAARLINTGNQPDAAAVFRSEAFIAGEAFAFAALEILAEDFDQNALPTFRVSILDAETDTLQVSQALSPQSIRLGNDCKASSIITGFSSHYFSTQAYTGQSIKIQFSQTSRSDDKRAFTLLDQVVIFSAGEQTNFFSRPHAQAGSSSTADGMPYLTAEGSFDPDKRPQALNYSWWLNQRQYQAERPCLSTLEAGMQHAILYVNDGHHAVSDQIDFYMPSIAQPLNIGNDGSCDPASPIEVQTTNDQASSPKEPSNLPEGRPLLDQNNKTGSPPSQTGTEVQAASPDRQTPPEEPEARLEPALAVQASAPLKPGDMKAGVIISATEPDKVIQNEKNTVTPGTESIEAATIKAPSNEVLRPLTRFNQKAYNLSNSGIHWIPSSGDKATLMITTPAYFPQQIVKLLDENGELLETAAYDGRPKKRARYRFTRPGSAYGVNSVLRIGNTDYLVRQPAQAQN